MSGFIPEGYPEKLYYFCLKKCSDPQEAEDLSSEILLHVLTALKRGADVENFPAWFWRVARNRYARWAGVRHRRAQHLALADIADDEPADTSAIDEDLLQREDIRLLRRELAFIAAEYREILLAYYVDDRSIRDIAAASHTPEGTVKARLFRARNSLKEGMNMAREFGIRSYKPEEVHFAASGSQPSGLPWRAVNRKIPNNILLAASDNPSTAEELAIELGIALPYMEEEIDLLEKATLLKKTGEKYVTNFYIFSRECQTGIYRILRDSSACRSEAIGQITSDSVPAVRHLGIVPESMSDADLHWRLMLDLTDHMCQTLKGYDIRWPLERADKRETWGFVGYESCQLPETIHMSHNGCGTEREILWTYRICDYDLARFADRLWSDHTALLADLLRNDRRINSLSEPEKSLWLPLDGRCAHADEEGRVLPDILVFHAGDSGKLHEIFEGHPLYAETQSRIQASFDAIVELLRQNSCEVLHKQLTYCASMEILAIRMMTLHDLVASGRLIVPENPKDSAVTMALYL